MEEDKLNNPITEPIGLKRNEDGTFAVGNEGGPGRPVMTPEEKLLKKAVKELIKEYKDGLAEALPLVKPVLIAKALEGDMPAIKELNDRVMGKAKETMELNAGLSIQFASEFNKDVDSTS